MPLKSRGRPRVRTQGRRIGPMVDAELLRAFDATALREGLSRNKALEEPMRNFVSALRQRSVTRDFRPIMIGGLRDDPLDVAGHPGRSRQGAAKWTSSTSIKPS